MADPLDVSSKPTRRARQMFQWLGFFIAASFNSRPEDQGTSPTTTAEPSVAEEQAAVSPIEPHPSPEASAGPVEQDSGYGSSVSAPGTLPGRQGVKEQRLKHFPRAIPLAVQNRFHDLRMLHAPALLDAVAKTKPRNISMKLKYLGESEYTARLYIVVQCDLEIVSKVKRFFSQKHVVEDLGSDFLIDVRGGTLLALAGSVALDVSGFLGPRATLCGLSILIRSGNACRRATLGGLISVKTAWYRLPVLYGVTAAHPAAALAALSIPKAAGIDDDGEEPSQPLVDGSTGALKSEQIEHDEGPRSNLGVITEPGLFTQGDLALIKLAGNTRLLPNCVSDSRPVARGSKHPSMSDAKAPATSFELFATPHEECSFHARRAAVLTCRGLQHGQISSTGSVLATSLASAFVAVFDFCPDQDASLLPGDSGSWVVSPLSGKVYGHVVSTDSFGEASVIPIQTSLREVKEKLRAHDVRLPTFHEAVKFWGSGLRLALVFLALVVLAVPIFVGLLMLLFICYFAYVAIGRAFMSYFMRRANVPERTDGLTNALAWFPWGCKDLLPGLRFGGAVTIISLLAITSESSVAKHSQTLTESFLFLLPRIIPAPHALLRASRPQHLPEVNANLVRVYSSEVVDAVGFFANVLHPLEDLKPFAFKVLEIEHTHLITARNRLAGAPATRWGHSSTLAGAAGLLAFWATKWKAAPTTAPPTYQDTMSSADHDSERDIDLTARKQQEVPAEPAVERSRVDSAKGYPVPPTSYSPYHLLSLFSSLLTLAILAATWRWSDWTAMLAITLMATAGAALCGASWWRPVLVPRRNADGEVWDTRAGTWKADWPGDVVIRTREGAFVLIRCTEDVARELYGNTVERRYLLSDRWSRLVTAVGMVLLMAGVTLLGNSTWSSQEAIGASYLLLNGLYWAVGQLPQRYFWDLGRYQVRDVTPEDSMRADEMTDNSDPRDGVPSFTRTLWFALRETTRRAWVITSEAMLDTEEWNKWLEEAVAAAERGNRGWQAVRMRDEIMRGARKNAEQHLPPRKGQVPPWEGKGRRVVQGS